MDGLTLEEAASAEIGAAGWPVYENDGFVDGWRPTLNGTIVGKVGDPGVFKDRADALRVAMDIRDLAREQLERAETHADRR